MTALTEDGNAVSEQKFARTGLLGFLGPVSQKGNLWAHVAFCLVALLGKFGH